MRSLRGINWLDKLRGPPGPCGPCGATGAIDPEASEERIRQIIKEELARQPGRYMEKSV